MLVKVLSIVSGMHWINYEVRLNWNQQDISLIPIFWGHDFLKWDYKFVEKRHFVKIFQMDIMC